MSTATDKHAVAYLRVSGKGQVDGDGFPRQIDAIAAWAAKAGYEIVRTYKEKGVSGTKDETERTAFAEMVGDLLSNGCRTIVVESLDRFARDLGVQMQLLAYVASKKLTLISAITGDDVTAALEDDPMRKAMVQMQGVFAELEKNLLVRKLRHGRERKKRDTGRCEGRPPFGFSPKHLSERPVLRALIEYRREGHTWERVAELLNERDFTTRYGRRWTKDRCSITYRHYERYRHAYDVLLDNGSRRDPGSVRTDGEDGGESQEAWGVA